MPPGARGLPGVCRGSRGGTLGLQGPGRASGMPGRSGVGRGGAGTEGDKEGIRRGPGGVEAQAGIAVALGGVKVGTCLRDGRCEGRGSVGGAREVQVGVGAGQVAGEVALLVVVGVQAPEVGNGRGLPPPAGGSRGMP